MTIIQKINIYLKKKVNFLSIIDGKTLRIQKFSTLFFISFLIIFSCLFFISSNLISKKNKESENNFIEITKTSEFSNLTNFLASKINSPYNEINYTIKANDTVEKILRNFKVKESDIKSISVKLKKKNLLIYILAEN